jgi:hypothetical protein
VECYTGYGFAVRFPGLLAMISGQRLNSYKYFNALAPPGASGIPRFNNFVMNF